MKDRVFSPKIVEWYKEHHRPLPWRSTQDPYKIWLSEIILQQTRVLQGLPYYQKFIYQYPSVKALAAASERDVLRLWQGLGYYSRARNLRKCALTVVNDHRGKFPSTWEQLKQLPGIGDYTAAAIASFSFGERVAVVDGNVFRVLSRLFGIHDDITSTRGKRKFTDLANRLIPARNPGLHNQAIMEFGATCCVPRNPNCEDCIFRMSCVARQRGIQHKLPVKGKAKKPKRRYFFYFVVRSGSKLMMTKRKQGDIWTGLYDFPLHVGNGTAAAKQIKAFLGKAYESGDEIDEFTISRDYSHSLTHQVINARFIEFHNHTRSSLFSNGCFTRSTFYSPRQIARLPKPVLISRYLHDSGVLQES